MSKEETLARLRDNREAYAVRVEAVEADLKVERDRRLGLYQEEIRLDVIRAFAQGAAIAAIGRAYGSKDYRTIKRIIESGRAEIQAQVAELEAEATPTWFELYEHVDGPSINVFNEEATEGYLIIPLELGEYLLDSDMPGAAFDGTVLTAASPGLEAELFQAIHERLGS